MRSLRLGLVLLLFGAAKNVAAQAPSSEGPAAEPAAAAAEGAQDAPADAPAGDAAPDPATAPESAPASEKSAESVSEPKAAPSGRAGPVKEVAPTDRLAAAPVVSAPTWQRARSPLTLEGRLGVLARPDSSNAFDQETNVGSDLGLSLYMDLGRELAAGLELERASLGRGSALSGLASVSTDYTVTSAMLGFRAYPKRGEMFDLYVGLQLGVGMQGISTSGTRQSGALLPPSSYKCGATDAPAFQLGGGVGARLMISPRWGIGARINGAGRRLSGDLIDDCGVGLGTATTLSASIGLGYDFELDRGR